MKNRFFIVAAGSAALILLASGISSADGNFTSPSGQENQQNQQDGQKYWGTPSHEIAGDGDQQSYDQSQAAIPGVAVSGARVFSFKGGATAPIKAATAVNLLLNHGGPTLAAPNIYAIWWGPTASFPVGYNSGITGYLANSACVSGSCTGLSALVNQYYIAPTKTALTYSGTYSDTSTPPSSAPTTSSILSEAYKVVVTMNKGKMDPQGIYLVYTTNFPAKAAYCGWHGAGSVNKAPFTVSYLPNLTTVAGCAATYLPSYLSSTNTLGVDSVVNVTSHELYETVTDPQLNAWYDSTGQEIGDKCAWTTSTKVVAGKTFTIQQEWSNIAKACASS